MSTKNTVTLDNLVSLCKRRGFVYPSSEIYGGLANCYDYGPLGVELLRNIKNLWWKYFITDRDDMLGLDSQILLHPKTWIASGHVDSFNDPLVEDKVTHRRYRVDHLIEEWLENQEDLKLKEIIVEDMTIDEMGDFISEHNIKSPEGNNISQPLSFNLLFESSIGSVEESKSKVYFRGETAQGIYTNFKQIVNSNRVKLPFGVGQIGKSFRNEVTTGQFIFRTLEFEQAEIEYFIDPNKTDPKQKLEEWKDILWKFITEELGIDENNLRWRRHTDKERSFYSADTYDLDYRYPFGWKELWGLAYRTDYDLKTHMKHSNQSLEYLDPMTGEKIVPHVIEPAGGINRLLLMVLHDAYYEEEDKKRLVLKLKPCLAPNKVAVFPLLKNKPEIKKLATKVYKQLKKKFATTWDDRGNIGKRYLYQDEIGTPYCITIDYQSLEDNTVTIRYRDTTEQKRVEISNIEKELKIC